MKRYICIMLAIYFMGYNGVFANSSNLNTLLLNQNNSDIISSEGKGPIVLLTLIQSFLLKVMLPVVVIGASLYIAYELFTAEGDESKMKRAWKSIAYSAIGLIAIALSYAIVNIISRLSF